jgi:acyl-CoA thioesterase YciA
MEGYDLCARHLVKYPDCNATQNLFGGQMLAWIDEAAAIYASKFMEENLVVTAHFGALDFKVPTELRKIVTIYGQVIKEGRTSLTVHVVAAKSDMGSWEEEVVAETEIVFVAVDENGKSKPWRQNI